MTNKQVMEHLKLLRDRNKKYKYSWQNGLEVFKWWMGENPNQLNFFEEIEKK